MDAAKKVCSKCKIEKSLDEFHKDNAQKSGYYPSCKVCKNAKVKELAHKYASQENRETKDTKVCSRCKIEKNISEYVNNRFQKDGKANECKNCRHNYYLASAEARIKYQKAYITTRRQNDPEFKLLTNMRCRLGDALRGKSKSQTTRQLVGIDFEIFTKWIQFQFDEEMTMENYGSYWQIDHVLPLSSFNLLDEELHRAMNWVNLRPLLPLKNLQKASKIDRWLYVMQEVKSHYFLKHLENEF
jgi:hypothetical protein